MSNKAQLFVVSLILIALLTGWFVAREKGVFEKQYPDSVTFCRTDSTTISLIWHNPDYQVYRFSVDRDNDGVVRVGLGVAVNKHRDDIFPIEIDTIRDRTIEIYGKVYQISEIDVCDR